MKTYRITKVVEIVAMSVEEAVKKADFTRVVPSIHDVSELVCCETSRHSNGWRHSDTCRNWVTQF